jgi:hypothetical protein
MTPRPFVFYGYVCYNYDTTLPYYLKRWALWGRRYNSFPGWFVEPADSSFENVNRVIFNSGNDGNDNNKGPPVGGNGAPPGDKHENTGDNEQPPNNDNNNTSSTVPPRAGTQTNPVQANIWPRAAGRIICGNVADNDDISSVSSTSSRSEENVQPVIQSTYTKRMITRGIQTWQSAMHH